MGRGLDRLTAATARALRLSNFGQAFTPALIVHLLARSFDKPTSFYIRFERFHASIANLFTGPFDELTPFRLFSLFFTFAFPLCLLPPFCFCFYFCSASQSALQPMNAATVNLPARTLSFFQIVDRLSPFAQRK